MDPPVPIEIVCDYHHARLFVSRSECVTHRLVGSLSFSLFLVIIERSANYEEINTRRRRNRRLVRERTVALAEVDVARPTAFQSRNLAELEGPIYRQPSRRVRISNMGRLAFLIDRSPN